MSKKAAVKKRKPTKIKEGITSKRTSTGINVTISTNGRVLFLGRGYNNNQNVQKGLKALSFALKKNLVFGHTPAKDRYTVTDLTPKPKKAAKKK